MTAPKTSEVAAYITRLAESAVEAAGSARAALAETIAAGGALDSHTLRPAMTAEAEALPWRNLLELTKGGADIFEALDTVRATLTRNLLERGESQSTDALANDNARLQREADRQFLRSTRGLD
ncbi:hypothetical protein [Streptomyces scabiei]|uniref:hypothetical protein n=1 Tax=Streptomyces scabiei TaxID=1930 RepID=UPI0029A838D8|nr:hypothetical protein [Streptomyces scabiei]MDX3126574.1 hypothetical protein [Streptomyces scabiei]MDX3203015.1 hypothetical protein [Streptomyces scabiei]MDX3223138.1 hypothetical protein [Streptomyces scabiei]